MTARQRFWIIITLVVLVIAGIAGTTVSFVVNGAASANSPAVLFVTGIGTTVIVMLIGLVQNQTITQVAQETKQIVNGGLAARVEALVHEILHEAPVTVAVPVTVGAPTPPSTEGDPHAQAPQ